MNSEFGIRNSECRPPLRRTGALVNRWRKFRSSTDKVHSAGAVSWNSEFRIPNSEFEAKP